MTSLKAKTTYIPKYLSRSSSWLIKEAAEILNPNFIRLFTVSPTEQDFTGPYLIFGNVFVTVLSPQGKQDLCLKFYGSRIESTSSQHTPKAFLATEPKSYISTNRSSNRRSSHVIFVSCTAKPPRNLSIVDPASWVSGYKRIHVMVMHDAGFLTRKKFEYIVNIKNSYMQTVKVTAGNCKIRSLQPNVIILSNKMMNQILPNLNTVYIIYPNSKKSPTSGSKSKLIWRGIILLRLSTENCHWIYQIDQYLSINIPLLRCWLLCI